MRAARSAARTCAPWISRQSSACRSSGARALELRLEVFNVFNRANFGNPTLIAFAGAAANEAPLSSFGRIRSTVTSARQMQLGARVS